MVAQDDIMKVLDTVLDPELGMSITELELVDDLVISDGKVKIAFHLTAQYCPPNICASTRNRSQGQGFTVTWG